MSAIPSATQAPSNTHPLVNEPLKCSSVAATVFKAIGAGLCFLGGTGFIYSASVGLINPVGGLITGIALLILGIGLLASMGGGSSSSYATPVAVDPGPRVYVAPAPVYLRPAVPFWNRFWRPSPVYSTPTGHAPVGGGGFFRPAGFRGTVPMGRREGAHFTAHTRGTHSSGRGVPLGPRVTIVKERTTYVKIPVQTAPGTPVMEAHIGTRTRTVHPPRTPFHSPTTHAPIGRHP